jgi:catechol 2,3-dioxygenase-like lactoylglutathione lyase family enzyme
MLTTNNPIAFIPTNDPSAARAFYETTLGLTFVSDDNFALVFRVGPTQTMLRIARAGDFTPTNATIFGWEVSDIHATITELSANGIEFLRFHFFEQDEAGVWTAPGGAQIAWFKDPDGNTLSLSTHP